VRGLSPKLIFWIYGTLVQLLKIVILSFILKHCQILKLGTPLNSSFSIQSEVTREELKLLAEMRTSCPLFCQAFSCALLLLTLASCSAFLVESINSFIQQEVTTC